MSEAQPEDAIAALRDMIDIIGLYCLGVLTDEDEERVGRAQALVERADWPEEWPPNRPIEAKLRAAAEVMADAVEDAVFVKDGYSEDRLRAAWQRYVEVAEQVDDAARAVVQRADQAGETGAPLYPPLNEAHPALIARAWHDVTCCEGSDCRDRLLHSAAQPIAHSGIAAAFLDRLRELVHTPQVSPSGATTEETRDG